MIEALGNMSCRRRHVTAHPYKRAMLKRVGCFGPAWFLEKWLEHNKDMAGISSVSPEIKVP